MKARIFVIAILLLLFAACNTPTREARRMVMRAERLADTLPDSTVRLIDSVLRMPANFSERERMDMALMQAEALFGCRDVSGSVSTISPVMDDAFFDDHSNISTSPELERAAAYFAQKKQYTKASHAALYSGFVQQYYNDNANAMQSFKDAEYYGKLVQDSLAFAQAQYWVGKMLLQEDLEEEALVMLQFADGSFGNHYADKSIVQNTIAVCHIMKGDYENAETSLQQSLVFAKKCRLDKVKLKALNNYAVLYQILGKYELAVMCLRQIAEHPDLDDNELMLLNINLGDVFIESNNIDSAAYYYQQVDSLLLKSGIRAMTKVSAYRFLSYFSEIQGDVQTALRFREKHEDLLYEIMNQEKEQAVFHIQKQYDYETLQNTMNKKLSQTKSMIALVIVLLFVVVVFYLYRAVQRNKKEAETKANLLRFMNQNQELTQKQKAAEESQQDIAQRLFGAQFKEALTMQRLAMLLENKGDAALLANLRQTVFEDQEPWDAFIALFDKMYPSLREQLHQQYPDLTEMEQKDVILSYFNLSREEEALLLKRTVHAVDKWRNSVRKKMGDRSQKKPN